jgi:hypothetical protein
MFILTGLQEQATAKMEELPLAALTQLTRKSFTQTLFGISPRV